MAKQKKEHKIAEQLVDELSNHYFDKVGFANRLVTFAPHYSIDQLMEILEAVIILGNNRYNTDWEQSITTEGLVKLRDWYRILSEADQLPN